LDAGGNCVSTTAEIIPVLVPAFHKQKGSFEPDEKMVSLKGDIENRRARQEISQRPQSN
jgi:hypothetical protein